MFHLNKLREILIFTAIISDVVLATERILGNILMNLGLIQKRNLF